jgi:hypothetical protein
MFFLNELSIACTSVSTLIHFIKNKWCYLDVIGIRYLISSKYFKGVLFD